MWILFKHLRGIGGQNTLKTSAHKCLSDKILGFGGGSEIFTPFMRDVFTTDLPRGFKGPKVAAYNKLRDFRVFL